MLPILTENAHNYSRDSSCNFIYCLLISSRLSFFFQEDQSWNMRADGLNNHEGLMAPTFLPIENYSKQATPNIVSISDAVQEKTNLTGDLMSLSPHNQLDESIFLQVNFFSGYLVTYRQLQKLPDSFEIGAKVTEDDL